MEEFCGRRANTWAYVINGYNDNDYDNKDIENKKVKWIKKCVIKRNIMLESYTDYLCNNQIILKSQQRFKSEHHDVYTV